MQRDTATEELLKQFIHFAKEKGITLEHIRSLYTEEGEQRIPLSVFASELSPSEGLCKYLKDNYKLSYAQIATLLKRDHRSVWTSVRRAEKKHPAPFLPTHEISIPLSIFSNRNHSILEQVISYLQKEYSFTVYKIAKVLNKTPAALYAVAKRGREKDA